MSDISIECRNLTVSYDLSSHKVSTFKEYVIMKTKGRLSKSNKTALKNVDFVAKKGECVALIGHNGCGKSTLLKCIAGILKPNEGSVSARGRIAPMIELGAGFDAEMTGRENVYLSCSLLGLTKAEIDEKILEIEKFAELEDFFDSPVKTYSSGMYMRLGFACTTAISADIVLIDEILAVGDENFQKKCVARINAIRSAGCTVILVSHDLQTVLNMAERAYVLQEGQVVFVGNPPDSISYYHKIMDAKRFESMTQAEQEEEARRIRLAYDAVNSSRFGKKAKVIQVDLQHKTNELGFTSLKFCLDIEIFADVDRDLVVGFALMTSAGQRVLGGNTKFLPDQPLEVRKKGIYRVNYELEKLPLATNDYQFIAAIHNYSLEETVDFQGGHAPFRLVNPKDSHNFDQDIINPKSALLHCTVEKLKDA